MPLIYYKIVAAILIFLTSLFAVIYPIRARAYPSHHSALEWADAFASGIFLGAALFHMLPEAITTFSDIYPNGYPIAEYFCVAGFLILLFFERLAEAIPSKAQAQRATPLIIALMLIIHSLIEGTALGINTAYATASMIFLAIIAHKGSASFALAVILNRSQMTTKSIIITVGIFSLMTPLGIGLGTTAALFLQSKTSQLLAAGFNAFAAGTFLYISTLYHINHHHHIHDRESLVEFFFLLVGLIIMAGLASL